MSKLKKNNRHYYRTFYLVRDKQNLANDGYPSSFHFQTNQIVQLEDKTLTSIFFPSTEVLSLVYPRRVLHSLTTSKFIRY